MDSNYGRQPSKHSRLRVRRFEERPGSRWSTIVEWRLEFDLIGTEAGLAEALFRFDDQWRTRGRLLDFADDWFIFLPTEPWKSLRGTTVTGYEDDPNNPADVIGQWVPDAWLLGNARRNFKDPDTRPRMRIAVGARIYRPGRQWKDLIPTSGLVVYTRSFEKAAVAAFGNQVGEGAFDLPPGVYVGSD